MANLETFKNPEAKPKSFSDLITVMEPQFKAALPAHLKANAERYMRLAMTEMRRNAALAKCDPYSVLGAAMLATQLGLEIGGTLGRAYLIPYGNQCTFVPGWKGLVELATRSGRASCWSGVLMIGQKHEYEQGDSPRLRILEDSDEDDPAKIAYAYAIGRLKGSEYPLIERWSVAKLIKHRDRYNKVGKRHYSYDNWEMYARKVPLLQVLKYLPTTPELEVAQLLDVRAERNQGLTLDAAVLALDGVDDAGAPPATPAEADTAAGGTAFATDDDVFASADDAVRDKNYDLASDLARSIKSPVLRKQIEDRIPKGGA